MEPDNSPQKIQFTVPLLEPHLDPEAAEQSLQALQYTQRATLLVALVRDALLVLTSDPVHPFQPGDSVWAKKFTTQGLTPTWKGLYTVALLTASRPGGTTPSSCTRKLPGS